MASDWKCVPRTYEVTKNTLQGYETYEHPLKLQTITVMDSKGTRGNPRGSFGSSSSSRASSSISLVTSEPINITFDAIDPLTQFARQEEELKDPLTQMATQKKTKIRREKSVAAEEQDDAPCWSSRRLGILNRFTTSEKLSISTSFLTTGAPGAEAIKAQTVVADKVKFRLEQLDHFEDGSMRHMMDLSQQEYMQRTEQLNQELVQSWNNEQRVKALKIVIQCSKMLTDTSVLQFYPSQFVLITDILDIFGKLVYNRLNTKASSDGDVPASGYSKKPSAIALRESAQETCQNWFYKIASIREVLPRLYVEMSIIKCYEFLTHVDVEQVLLRITKMIRGIGDPLVATYARCYLLRVGLSVSKSKTYIMENLKDFFSIYQMIFSGSVRSELNRQRIGIKTYLTLYSPALDFMLQALGQKHSIYTEEILENCKQLKNNGPLLMSILHAFKPEFIAANALEIITILANCNTEGISKAQLFRALGSSISSCPPLSEQRLTFLQNAFQTINTFTDPAEYINCVETWSIFIAENFQIDEVNTLLGALNMRMSQCKTPEKHYAQLQSILNKIMQNFKDIELLLIQPQFLPYLDLFQKIAIKIDVCKSILTHFESNSQQQTSDAIVINTLMYIGKILNDYITALTVDDERRQISQLIEHFIRKVNFARDFERQLAFYVEARAQFANLADGVYNTLVHAVNKLAMETRKIVNGKHTHKTSAFVKACIAYCYITIPSISSVQLQMDLYLLSGQVALMSLCLGQADACFEAALCLVADLPRSIEIEGKIKSLEQYVVSYLCNMLATLVVVPDSPEQGALYLLRLLLDALNKFPFEVNSSGPITVYLHALDFLYVQSLDEFPYHIPDVVSNDELYGHDPKFLTEINNLCMQVIDQILNYLKTLGLAQQLRTQGTLALDLFLRITRFADLNREKTFQLAINLWLLAIKQESYLDAKLIPRTRRYVEETYKLIKDNNAERAQGLAQLIMRMQ